MARPDKEAAVAALADKFRQADAVLLTEYRGLSVAQLKELRRALGAETEYAVVKNTLAAIAAKEVGIDAFEGPPRSLRAGIHQGRPDRCCQGPA